MLFTLKDIITTAALLVVLLITYALLCSLEWPFLGNWLMVSILFLAFSLRTIVFIGFKAVPRKHQLAMAATTSPANVSCYTKSARSNL